MAILRRTTQRNSDMIFPVRNNRNNPTGAKSTAQRFTVIAFVQPQALRFTFALADADAIKGGQDGSLVMPIGFGDGEVERMPMRLDEEVTFEPANTVFARVANLRRSPFFDLITLAS